MSEKKSSEAKVWLKLFSHGHTSKENDTLLSDFFFHRSTINPQLLFQFLVTLKGNFVRTKDRDLRQLLASRYLKILSPICERFGFFHEKGELDTLCFKIINPKEYTRVEALLLKYKKKSKKVVEDITVALENLLKERKYDVQVKGRYKHLFSIAKKLMKKKTSSILALADIFAFRIILAGNSSEKCFDVANLLHDKFYPIAGHFKDYITVPKVNGYQSIHTVLNHVLADLDLPIEIQIRTETMDDIAERGVASHWLYSRSKKSELLSEKERKILEHFQDMAREGGVHDGVYILSPKGDIFALPKGSTILDLAFHIHSNIGSRTEYAIVDGVQSPITHVLRDGDTIDIVCTKERQAKQSWLKIAQNPSTRKKIHEQLSA